MKRTIVLFGILLLIVGVAVAMSKSVRSVDLCPFDGLPCEFVKGCDDALSLYVGFDVREGDSCSRAVYKVGEK